MKKILFCILITFLSISIVYGKPLHDNDFSIKMMNYFIDKPESFIDESIEYIASKSNIDGAFRDILLSFYSKCFQNKNFREAINAKLSISKSKTASDFFNAVSYFDIDEFITSQKPSAHLNDLIWAAYFASGEIKYLDYLFNLYTKNKDESKDINLFLAAGSAGWSIAANSREFSAVVNYLQSIKTPENSNVIDDLLTSDPSIFEQRQIDFIKIQRKNGIW